MSPEVNFGCLPTAIGSMPHVDPEAACSLVLRYLPDIPAWPQLPNRSPKERMYIQYSEGFPGVVTEGNKIHIEPGGKFESGLEQIYLDCEAGDFDKYDISAEYAAGLHTFLSQGKRSDMVKGQIIGPITWGLTVIGQDGRAVLYDDTLAEIGARFLRLKAAWQENALRRISPNTIIFLDEPYLVSLGSAFVPLSREKVIALLEETLQGIKGLKGLHCCGNTDWSLPLSTTIDVLSFDAYTEAVSLGLYPVEVKAFLARGGNIAWGIIPNDEESLAKESLFSLYDRLGEAMAPFTRDGLSFKQVVQQGLITPSCGLTALSPEAAELALELSSKLSDYMRKKYIL
ncbi:MAG: methionine synthase [Dehalococcoidia bacterium]|nr:methionine synthase [Dehalococcoidia bacterium]